MDYAREFVMAANKEINVIICNRNNFKSESEILIAEFSKLDKNS